MFHHPSLVSTCLLDKYSSYNNLISSIIIFLKNYSIPSTSTSQHLEQNRIPGHLPKFTYTWIHSFINLWRHLEYTQCRSTILDLKNGGLEQLNKNLQDLSKSLYFHHLNSLLFAFIQLWKQSFHR